MQRENYFILLELSVDPPENDPEIISKAIQTKKVEWSRLRNHPTKGLQIQKFINMIPDIENVMLDEALRNEEALAAAEFIESGKESKISEIDGHIDILMGKGYIAKEDIVRLSEIHGISQNEINDRIASKKNVKYTHIDQQIGLRMGKGYITEDELIKISKKNAMDVDEIRKRIRCPIIKDEKEAENLSIRPLDKSIDKAITDNLNIIGKKSLYDFLELTENAELKRLQDTAGKKKRALSSAGKKDAVITAGVTLAGHCLTIFKNNETRIAYDVSLAKGKLSTLDSDINIAAINNKIRHEYFDALIKKAMEFGMDKEEASSYIQSFCQRKKYRIEPPPEKKRRRLIAVSVSALAAIVLVAAFLVFSKIHHKNVIKSEYQELIKKTDARIEPDHKIQLLKQYLSTHDKNEYSDDAKDRITRIESQINAEKFSRLLKQADLLVEEQKLDDALALYESQIAIGMNKENKKLADKKVAEILTLIEKRDFEALTTVSLKGEPDQKIKIYQNYLKSYPQGKHKDQVQGLINEMSGEYYIYVRNKLEIFGRQERWEDCLQICQSYIDIYDNSNSDQLRQLIPNYQENVRNAMIYASLIEKAEKMGSNYDAAGQILKDYLEAYPKSSITEKIKREITRLDNLNSIQIKDQATNAMRLKFAETKGRFIEEQPGVIKDTKTGLMWSMIDSDNAMPDTCLTYEQGKEYVEALTTGGFTDWRLPSPEELAGIFKTAPAFPVNGKKSYWTTESYSGYSDGWHIQVATFSSDDSTIWEIVRKNALECGAVRAVRKP